MKRQEVAIATSRRFRQFAAEIANYDAEKRFEADYWHLFESKFRFERKNDQIYEIGRFLCFIAYFGLKQIFRVLYPALYKRFVR